MFKIKPNDLKWIAYDWANSVFATSIVAAFFPIILKNYWGSHLSAAKSTFYLGATNSITSFIVFFLAIITGYLVDHKFKKPQKILFFLAIIGAGLSASLSFVGENDFLIALVIYSLSFICFATGNTIYDSLLTRLKDSSADVKKLEKLSSLGYFAGYLGGGALLLFQAFLIIFHKKIGLLNPITATKISLFSVGVWWTIFSLPLLSLKIKENDKNKKAKSFFKALKDFYFSLNKKSKFFLIAYFLYIDVVFTTYKMAVDFGLSIGLNQYTLIGILIYVQFIGAPGTLFIQHLSNKKNVFFALLFAIACYALALSFSPFVKSVSAYIFLASLIGLSQGGIQSLSRAYFANITPKNMQGMSFGFLNLIGKASAVLGPMIIGYTALFMNSNTYSIMALLPVLFLGVFFLIKSSRI